MANFCRINFPDFANRLSSHVKRKKKSLNTSEARIDLNVKILLAQKCE